MGSSDMLDMTWWDWIKTEEVLLKELKQGFSVRKANTFIGALCSQKPEYCGSAREALMKACKEIPMSDDDCKQIVDPVMKNFCEKNSNKDKAACKQEEQNNNPPTPESATKGHMSFMLMGAIGLVVLVVVCGMGGLLLFLMKGSSTPPPDGEK